MEEKATPVWLLTVVFNASAMDSRSVRPAIFSETSAAFFWPSFSL